LYVICSIGTNSNWNIFLNGILVGR
jgi:hypothetical protein